MKLFKEFLAELFDKPRKATLNPDLTTKAQKANPRFISTMKHHLEIEGLNKGRLVRIISTPELFHHYRHIVRKLNKDGHYREQYGEENHGGKTYHYVELHHKNQMTESIRHIFINEPEYHTYEDFLNRKE